jgi:carbon starvation protein
MLSALALGFLLLLVVGYRSWGGVLARSMQLDDTRATPAVAQEDGVDFVPTGRFYLFAQHFSAIAAAGPIVGPIAACMTFGWLPCLLWIGLGVVFIGAVHDFTSLFGSIRHGGRSIADMAKEQLGPGAGRAMLAFIWIALIYVIIAFTDVTAETFLTGGAELEGARFDPGGAVAAAATMYLGLSLAMGLVQRFLRPPLWLLTLVFVPATFGVAWLGTAVSQVLVLERSTWIFLILAYCALASFLPVWALLQPRGYLGGFVLYSALAMGLVGVLFGGYSIEQPAFKTFEAGGATGSLFPFLFVTIACGACSGFHGLVCSGTTSKQVERESDARWIGYGAMLAEGFVAMIALVTVMICTQADLEGPDGKPLGPGKIYGNGIGRFLTLLIGPDKLDFAVTFGAMAFSTFVFDTLDVCTRLSRYMAQELFGTRRRSVAALATLASVALPFCVLSAAPSGSWRTFWTLFGASNQLLAALTLLVVSVWLRRRRIRAWATLAPMAFVLSITLWALARLAVSSHRASRGFDLHRANELAALALLALALFMLTRGLRARSSPAL